MRGYPAEKLTPVKRQMVKVSPMVPEFSGAVNVNRLLNASCEMISDVQSHCKRYLGVSDNDGCLPSGVQAGLLMILTTSLCKSCSGKLVVVIPFRPMTIRSAL